MPDEKPSKSSAEKDEAFPVTIDPNMKKPLVRWKKPGKDKDGNSAVDVFEAFVKGVSTGDFKTARKYCHLEKTDYGGIVTPSIGDKDFPQLCKKWRRTTKKVVISGNVLPSKGPYWWIPYKLTDTSGKIYMSAVDVRKVDGRWKVLEKGIWHDNIHEKNQNKLYFW